VSIQPRLQSGALSAPAGKIILYDNGKDNAKKQY
jgi:hypothetical protein